MVELVRRRQKEEIMGLLKEEEARERDRLEALAEERGRPEELARL
jgi:rRNA maturation protein Rpf1